MDNLIFSINATLPIFFTMAAGILFKKLRFIDDAFATGMNKFVFKIALPIFLFDDLSKVAFNEVWDVKFVGYCFGVTVVCIFVLTLLSFFFVKKEDRGEFIQGSYGAVRQFLDWHSFRISMELPEWHHL